MRPFKQRFEELGSDNADAVSLLANFGNFSEVDETLLRGDIDAEEEMKERIRNAAEAQVPNGFARGGSAAIDVQKLQVDINDYAAPKETCFAGTSFERCTINGRIPSGNNDIQVFADRTIRSDGEIHTDQHDVLSICKLQYFCMRECWIQNNPGPGDYLKKLKDFPAFDSNFQEQLTAVVTLCEQNDSKSVYPLRLNCNADPSNTLIHSVDHVLIIVPNNIGFINGVINFVLGNFTDQMKLIYTATRSIRQGKLPVQLVMKKIKENVDSGNHGFHYYVIVNSGTTNVESTKIMVSIMNQNAAGIVADMRVKNGQ